MKKTIISLGLAAVATGCGGGESKSQSNSQVTPTPVPVQQALETGNALLVSDPNDFIRESRQVVEAHKKQSNAIKSAIAKIFRVFTGIRRMMPRFLLLPMDSTTPS